ncbi:hypothetical protein BFG57_01895 [Bacillus solimangrovi]|uniref:DUF418 domain-containing protein n=2 Tax=Bacillus solimangrovi TaxID=1305675 RepID=A0A1E5LFL4_9BACI|nr:hypothetical protein BFG57_01895 [Bacillus solimangrovi]
MGKERIIALDIIRGFALFGILLVNMPSFSGSDLFLYSGIDLNIRLIFDLFIQTKFYTIFSFLFGLGFYIFMKRAESRGENVNRLFTKRLLALLLFGVLHIVFFWDGDILHTYAILGFFLLLFYRRTTKTVLIWTIVILVGYLLFLVILNVQSGEINNVEIHALYEKLQAYQSLPYGELLIWRFANEIPPLVGNIPYSINIFGMFLLGLYAGKLDIFRNVDTFKKLLKRTQLISFLLSVPTLILMTYIFTHWLEISTMLKSQYFVLMNASGMTLSVFYITSITLLLEKHTWRQLLHPLRYVGQMALTNYLLQTIICFIIFYWFGLFGKVTLWQSLIITIIIYPVQVMTSYMWLRRFQFGPFEWLWRIMTYGKVQQLKKKRL